MSGTRILLVPQVTELEWVIKPLLEEWAEVASYDAPGVGDEPAMKLPLTEAVAARGLSELDRRGWERTVIVADEFGVAAALHLAVARPEAVEAVAFGHARLSNDVDGERAPLNREVMAALGQLVQHDFKTFVHQFVKLTQGEEMKGGYTDDLVDTYLERVPLALEAEFFSGHVDAECRIKEQLDLVSVPMLFAQHKGCLLYSDEGFEDAVAAFPDARSEVVGEKPSVSPEFASILRSFCEQRALAG